MHGECDVFGRVPPVEANQRFDDLVGLGGRALYDPEHLVGDRDARYLPILGRGEADGVEGEGVFSLDGQVFRRVDQCT